MLSLLRLKRKQKNSSIHFEFVYFLFFLTHLELKRQIRSYTHIVPSKTIPDSRQNWAKFIPVFRPKGLKTIPFGAAHTYMAYIKEFLSPPENKHHLSSQEIEASRLMHYPYFTTLESVLSFSIRQCLSFLSSKLLSSDISIEACFTLRNPVMARVMCK